jgi:L-aspartate oxidase
MRRPEGLAAAAEALDGLADRVSAEVPPTLRAYEATNMLTVARAVVASATARTESRGCHRRSDYTEPRDIWLTHLLAVLDDGGLHIDGIPKEDL